EGGGGGAGRHPHRRAGRGGEKPERGGGAAQRPLPRGSVLPPLGGHHSSTPAPRSRRGRGAPRQRVSASQLARPQAEGALQRRGLGSHREVSVAGPYPRAGEQGAPRG